MTYTCTTCQVQGAPVAIRHHILGGHTVKPVDDYVEEVRDSKTAYSGDTPNTEIFVQCLKIGCEWQAHHPNKRLLKNAAKTHAERHGDEHTPQVRGYTTVRVEELPCDVSMFESFCEIGMPSY